jgi:hypothetical protein
MFTIYFKTLMAYSEAKLEINIDKAFLFKIIRNRKYVGHT